MTKTDMGVIFTKNVPDFHYQDHPCHQKWSPQLAVEYSKRSRFSLLTTKRVCPWFSIVFSQRRPNLDRAILLPCSIIRKFVLNWMVTKFRYSVRSKIVFRRVLRKVKCTISEMVAEIVMPKCTQLYRGICFYLLSRVDVLEGFIYYL